MNANAGRRKVVEQLGAALLFCASAFLACNAFDLDISWRDGDFALMEVDSREQMSLVEIKGDGRPEVIIGPTVFAVGANDRAVVVKQHPNPDGLGASDRSRTNFFVVMRSTHLAKSRIVGPLTKDQFEEMSKKERLPPFSERFADLE